MSRARPSSLSRTNSALRSSSAIAVIRLFAALNSASSRSIATSLSAAEHPPPPGPPYARSFAVSASRPRPGTGGFRRFLDWPPVHLCAFLRLSSFASRVGLAPTLLLIGRLGSLRGLLWRFYGRDPLQCRGQQPTGFGVGLALGLQLFAERGDKLAGAVVGTPVGSLLFGCRFGV